MPILRIAHSLRKKLTYPYLAVRWFDFSQNLTYVPLGPGKNIARMDFASFSLSEPK